MNVLLQLKKYLRTILPKPYYWLWLGKRYLNQRILGDTWAHYYDGRFTEPEAWLYDIPFPAYIDTILDVGCGNGRNFVPFDGKLNLWGVDIVPENRIKWVRPFKSLRYEQKTLENLARFFEREPVDLSRTLIFTAGTMMYASRRNQERFYRACKQRGCQNFIFHEHSADSKKHPIENFKLPPEWFTVKKMRENEPNVRAFFDLDGA